MKPEKTMFITDFYDPESDVYEISGVKISRQVFKWFGNENSIGRYYRLVSNDEGVITIKEYADLPKCKPITDEELAVELLARFHITMGKNDRIKRFVKSAFIDGVLWANQRITGQPLPKPPTS